MRFTRVSAEVICPFCAQREEIQVDLGGGTAQIYTEDCPVCCHPRVVHVETSVTGGRVHVWVERGQ